MRPAQRNVIGKLAKRKDGLAQVANKFFTISN